MNEFAEYHKSITRKSLLAAGALVLIGLAVAPSYGLGFFLGCAGSIAAFQLKVRQYAKLAALPGKKASASVMRGNFVRFLILGAFLAVAFYNKHVNGFAAGAGLFLTNAVIIVDQIITCRLLGARQ
jgi:hypothetical protein